METRRGRPPAASAAVHQHRTDAGPGEPEELTHDVDHALQPYLVHAADRPGADRVAVQGHDRRGFRGHAERGRHVHHCLLGGGAAALTAPDLSSSGISGNGMLAKCTLLGDTPCPVRTDAVSRKRMLLGALIATVWPLRPARVVTGESGIV